MQPYDVVQTTRGFVICVDMPGVVDMSVEHEPRQVRIYGVQNTADIVEDGLVLQRGRPRNEIDQTVKLPDDLPDIEPSSKIEMYQCLGVLMIDVTI